MLLARLHNDDDDEVFSFDTEYFLLHFPDKAQNIGNNQILHSKTLIVWSKEELYIFTSVQDQRKSVNLQ